MRIRHLQRQCAQLGGYTVVGHGFLEADVRHTGGLAGLDLHQLLVG